MTTNWVKEDLSFAYVRAICARLGFECSRPERDRDGWDIQIVDPRSPVPDDHLQSPTLQVQLKATSAIASDASGISFPLPVDNYNALIQRRHTPAILVVYEQPRDEALWLSCGDDELVLRSRAYWRSLWGEAPTTNESSVTVRLSRTQLLTPISLRRIMAQISAGARGVENDGE